MPIKDIRGPKYIRRKLNGGVKSAKNGKRRGWRRA